MNKDFGQLVEAAISGKFPSIRAFIRAAEADRDESSGVGYASMVIKGKRPPPLERLAGWADALELKGEERQRFFDLAAIAHLPPVVRPRFARILDDYTKLRTAVTSMEQRISELEKDQPSKSRKR